MKTTVLKSISVMAFVLITGLNCYAEEWLDLATLADQQIYQVAPTTMATTEFGGDMYIIIDARYLSSRGAVPRLETVAIPKSVCTRSSGNILIKRDGEREVQIPFIASAENLPFRITQVICRTYENIKTPLEK